MKRRSRRNSDKQKLSRLVLFVVAVLVVGFVVPRVVSFMGVVALYPFQMVQGWWQETSLAVPALWRDKVAMQEQIVNLQAELAAQTEPSLSLQILREDNQELRALLGATTTQRTAAVVTGRPGQLPYDVLQIDQGSAAGIATGDPVYNNAVQVIGLVSRVYPGSSLVTLLTSPEFTATAYMGETNLLVPLEGLGGGSARVAVPQGVPLQVGALVHLPSIQPGVFGRVSYVENEPTQPQQFGYITPEVALQHLRHVSVGKSVAVQTGETDVREYIQQIQTELLLPDLLVPTSTATSSSATSTTNLI